MEDIVQSFTSKIQVVLPLGLPSPPRTPSSIVQPVWSEQCDPHGAVAAPTV